MWHCLRLLLALVDHGITREDAYRLVQEHALAAWEGGETLLERVQKDSAITERVPEKDLAAVFDVKRHLQHVDYIFERVLKEA